MTDNKQKKDQPYQGFEQGPIRPPSEAYSLLIRVTRNCPWNRCAFCPVYKGSKFSLRPPEHIKADIDAVYRCIQQLKEGVGDRHNLSRQRLIEIADGLSPNDQQAFQAALNWFAAGSRSVFLQDANSMIIKPPDMVDILTHLYQCFPDILRVTSYARSRTVARIKPESLSAIRQAGLNRLHMGLESGSDEVLELVKKGVSKADHIKAGVRAKEAGFELSEYVMPGLGGQDLSETHARESADALNQINPDYIRLRTLAIPSGVPLYEEYQAGRFKKCTDIMMTRELIQFLEQLEGITSTITSDHILNLFEEVTGKLPEDKEKMLAAPRRFLEMDPHDQMLYQVGRRLSVFRTLDDMNDSGSRQQVEAICQQNGITPDNADAVIEEVMNRFI